MTKRTSAKYKLDRRQEQRAMEQSIKGWTPECLVIPRKRTRETLDQNQPQH